ncbi:hypothetical protein DPV78_006171 [Talaromyces pinophilus]|nr:hypothetical protein DPV78_006171 [Talaromyces pinophilus]
MTSLSGPVQGITGEYTGSSFTVRATIIALLSCALYSAVELSLLIFLTFRRYHGLYFWSLLVSTMVGVIPQALGLLLKYFALAPLALSVTLSTVGWAVMVTGQSLVLYSRLNLLVRSTAVLRFVLWMIIVDAIILQIPQIIFSYAAVFGHKSIYPQIYNIWARVQLTGFFVQEVIISTIFIVHAVRLLQLYPMNTSQRKVLMMYQLLIMNVGLILMDISLLVLEYMNEFIIQTVLKTFLYTVKLKFEFVVLSRLVSFVSAQHEVSNVQPLTSGASELV